MTFQVNEQKIHALMDVDLSINKGELVSLMGRSGSGKSTIINIIAGLLHFEKGSFFFYGKEINHLKNRELLEYRRTNIGMIVQEYASLKDIDELKQTEDMLYCVIKSSKYVPSSSGSYNITSAVKLIHDKLNLEGELVEYNSPTNSICW